MTEATLAQSAERSITTRVIEGIRGTRLSNVAKFALVGAVLAGTTGAATDSAQANNKGGHHLNTVEAVGESVAAGLGLPPSPDASPEDELCGRSPQAYPNLVAEALGMELGKNASCQGAVVADLTTSRNFDGTTIQPQLDTAFASGKPGLLTMTIGANDVGYSEFINKCFALSACDTEANTELANSRLTTLKGSLKGALRNIRSRPGKAPTTVVTGYYRPVSEQCALLGVITPSEIAWLNERTDDFNSTIERVAEKFRFARFAEVADDFDGHDVCSLDPWVQRPGGLPGEPKPFHPTARGQQAMAEAVVEVVR